MTEPNPAFLAHLLKRADMSAVPQALQSGLAHYCAARRPMGSFLTAVVSNDLYEAIARADQDSRLGLANVVFFLYNYAPGECWGSPEKVAAWLGSQDPVPENFD